jgi:hypothetical protein
MAWADWFCSDTQAIIPGKDQPLFWQPSLGGQQNFKRSTTRLGSDTLEISTLVLATQNLK